MKSIKVLTANFQNCNLIFLIIVIGSFFSFLTNTTNAQIIPDQAKKLTLPNGWSLEPTGTQIPLGDLPLNIAVSPDKKFAAITNNGQSTQSVQLISLQDQKVLDAYKVGKSWLGLVFSDDGKSLYASGGNDNWIVHFVIRKEKLVCLDTIKLGKPWPEKISVAGIALDETKHRLYAVTKDNNSLYITDTKTKKIIKQLKLGGEGYTCILSPDKKHLYCSCWGCDKIVIVNAITMEIEDRIPVGDNPNDLALDHRGKILFVANANDNSVSVIDLSKKVVIETLNSALFPGAPTGSTTNSVALSNNDKILYVANADNNCLALFDVSDPGHSKGMGFIPTGWYPTCVRIAGSKILVADGKGLSSLPNPKGPNPVEKKKQSGLSKSRSGKGRRSPIYRRTL